MPPGTLLALAGAGGIAADLSPGLSTETADLVLVRSSGDTRAPTVEERLPTAAEDRTTPAVASFSAPQGLRPRTETPAPTDDEGTQPFPSARRSDATELLAALLTSVPRAGVSSGSTLAPGGNAAVHPQGAPPIPLTPPRTEAPAAWQEAAALAPSPPTAGQFPASADVDMQAPAPAGPDRQALVENYGRLPLTFEANQGQTDDRVQFLSRGSGYALFLTGTEAVLSLSRPAAEDAALDAEDLLGTPDVLRLSRPAAEDAEASEETGTVVRMQVVGARTDVAAVGREPQPGKVHYFTGDDPAAWRTNIPTYGRVEYPEIYPGIDLVYYGNQRQLEYDFVLAPGADPSVIGLNFSGAEQLSIDASGNLVLDTASGQVVQQKPFLYQEVNGVRQEVAGGYVLHAPDQVGFAVGAYNPSRALVIDPILSYSSYHGGSSFDFAYAVAVDSSGSAYVTGETQSTDFPTRTGAIQTTFSGFTDVFVTKVSSNGASLAYSTYLGGAGRDRGSGIAVDASGNAYVTGRVGDGFPTTAGVLRPDFGGGSFDAAVTKLNAAGSALVYSTYLGGSANDAGFGIAVDSGGNAHVTGGTQSVGFPITGTAFQEILNFSTDMFYTRLNATGSSTLYSTYLGGSSPDRGNAIALDGSGLAYIGGHSYSDNLPTTNGAFQEFRAGSVEGFVAKFDPSKTGFMSMVYLTYLGGSEPDQINSIAVDSGGNAYVAGETVSVDFPTRNAFQPTYGGGFNDGYVTKLNATATAPLVYSTFLGGAGDDRAYGLAINSAGNAYVTGFTESDNFPTRRAVQPARGGSYDAFVTQLSVPGTGLVYSTFLGGSSLENQLDSGDFPGGIAVDASGNAYVVGRTSSTDFPRTVSFQPSSGGQDDGFVTKIMDDATAPLSVSGFGAATPSAVVVDFNRPLDPSALTVYDVQSRPLGPADVMLTGATTGTVSGSLFIDSTGTRLTFLRSGGPLPADTYTLTLRSAANGFKDASGGLLDGNRDGTTGDNFVGMFTVGVPAGVIVSVPDFARGPGQTVNVPATATRLPLQLSSGAGVVRVDLTLFYNPALLTVTSASIGGSPVPPTANVSLNTNTPGRAVLTFTSPTALPAGPIDFVTLAAQVPGAAPYGASHVLDIDGVVINSFTPGRDDDGVHAVAYFGDATGNRAYSSADATRVLRVAVGLDSGFTFYSRISPIVVADINRNGRVDATDANRILQEATGSDRPEIPPIV